MHGLQVGPVRFELWYFKLTGGLLHGYKEPYDDKIPLNDLGVAPAILPTLGFQYKFFVAEANLAGHCRPDDNGWDSLSENEQGKYQAKDIEVLTGLEPVKRRPGMYTDTSRPNHLAMEVIDNSVDEALAGHAGSISVTAYEDGSVEVSDDGRGMPVDIHPEQGIPGVELILTKLHAGGKFSDKNYQFAGGLHGVGVSVVNALSSKLEVWIKRDGSEHYMSFADGDKNRTEAVGTVGQRNTGTRIRFWPDPDYFDSPNFSLKRLRHLLRAKAVLCPGLNVSLTVDKTGEKEEWCYQEGLADYLQSNSKTTTACPRTLQRRNERHGFRSQLGAVLAARRRPVAGKLRQPDPDRPGRHPRQRPAHRPGGGLREFCEHHNLLPRGLRLTPDDIWEKIGFILSVKLSDPQFSGQTKERLSSRACATFVSGIIKDAFSLWLNQNVTDGEAIAQLAIANAQKRMKIRAQSGAQKSHPGPGPARQAGGLHLAGPVAGPNCSWWKATRPAAQPSRRATANTRPSCRCAARS